jgi:hypothetical protein
MKRPLNAWQVLFLTLILALTVAISSPWKVFAQSYFLAGFETGTVVEWIGDGGGNQTGGAYVTAEISHTGKYSWKAYNDPSLSSPDNVSAKLLRWRFDYTEANYSAWYFWPTDYSVSGAGGQYVNIFQWKERASPYDPTWVVAVKNSYQYPGQDEIVVHDYRGARIYRNAIRLPKGRWFRLEAYLRTGRADGHLTVWLDGTQIFDFSNINTLGNISNPSYLMWGVGNYGDSGIGKFIFVDDAEVTTPRSLVTQPRPPENLRITQ